MVVLDAADVEFSSPHAKGFRQALRPDDPQVLWPLLATRWMALEVIADDQDHTVERLIGGDVVGCISTRAKPPTGFVAEPLG